MDTTNVSAFNPLGNALPQPPPTIPPLVNLSTYALSQLLPTLGLHSTSGLGALLTSLVEVNVNNIVPDVVVSKAFCNAIQPYLASALTASDPLASIAALFDVSSPSYLYPNYPDLYMTIMQALPATDAWRAFEMMGNFYYLLGSLQAPPMDVIYRQVLYDLQPSYGTTPWYADILAQFSFVGSDTASVTKLQSWALVFYPTVTPAAAQALFCQIFSVTPSTS